MKDLTRDAIGPEDSTEEVVYQAQIMGSVDWIVYTTCPSSTLAVAAIRHVDTGSYGTRIVKVKRRLQAEVLQESKP